VARLREQLSDKVERADTIRNIFSDSGIVRAIIDAPLMINYLDKADERQEFPNGLHATFYDEFNNPTSTLTAKWGVYRKRNRNVTVRDSVVWESTDLRGSEIAYVSANKLRVELKKKRGTRASKILAGWFDRPADFMSTMLVGNNIALVAFTTLISGSFAWLIGPTDGGMLNLLGETVILTLIVLVFGEYLPKTLFRLYADDALYVLALPLRALQRLLYLPSLVMTGTSNALLRLFFNRPAEELDTVLTRLDLENFVNESRASADEDTVVIDTKLFGNALNLSEVRATTSAAAWK